MSLPSVGERLGGLADDVEAIGRVLDGLDGPVVLVGHSYGGLPVTEAAATRDDVAHVVYVCAFAVPVGTALLDAVGGQPPEWWIPSADGASITPANPGDGFFGTCEPEELDHGGPAARADHRSVPIRLRYSGASISYMIGSVIGGGIAPLLATALFAEFRTSAAVSTLMVVISLISLLAILPAGRRVLQAGEEADQATAPVRPEVVTEAH